MGLHACGGGSTEQGPPNTQAVHIDTPTQARQTNTPTQPALSATPTRPGPSNTPRPGPSETPTRPPPSDTPSPSPSPTATPPDLIVRAGGSIAAAVRRAPEGATIIVSPGLYPPLALGPGDVQGSIALFADITGQFTNSAAGAVVIDAHGQPAAISLSDLQFEVTLDGFTVRGGADAGVLAVRSPGVFVTDCSATGNGGDGVRLQQSDDSLVFNNLIWNNAGTGISVLQTNNAAVINNTVYHSLHRGIFVGFSPNAFVENNIFNKNVSAGIFADAASTAYTGDFNLNTDGYEAGTPAGVHDINAAPQFIFPSGGDFHLSQTSPAIDQGDFNTDPGLVDVLSQLTTQSDGTLDTDAVDLGFHYLPPQAFDTPTPVPPTPTSRPPTATRTPTAHT